MSVQHSTSSQSFTSGPIDNQAELAYSLPAAGVIDFVHTFVPEAQRGQGIAEELAETALAYARQHQLRVRTSCEFMAGYVQRNESKYSDLLDK
ncbi:GNAT family N-acetyltransferase [Hymenobacter sp. H14-R3]|uniref:GNAT family N-acetyltransferase n=1 Tax=Hymenobacter sp. H14-R3 TaxID=3046308 RepID=UPI0024BA00F7|nr:GNAT family N-acetyltransferase [Hymenobacter sp. H14-R3]MDJ0364689.1 GNAT family N-acetyltransferase [Hymenobacter sp. H14-R3]